MTRPLRVAIEANVLAVPMATGVARYVQQLALAIDRLVAAGDEQVLATLLYRFKRRRHRGLIQLGQHLQRSVWIGAAWPPASRYDCVLCTFKHMPSWPGVPKIATVHDMHYELGLGSGNEAEDRALLRARQRLLAGAAHAVCVSQATRRDLIRFHPGMAGRSTVVHLGVEERFRPAAAEELAALRRRFELDRPFLLFIGHGAQSKNLQRLLSAYRISAATRGVDLVIAGPAGLEAVGPEQPPPDPERRIRAIGFVDDATLPALYSAALAFMLPSLSEGFGLPILEALRCGTPVLTSDRGSCPEVAAGHATLVDPYEIESIAAGIGCAIATGAGARAEGRRYAEGKTWADTARATLALLREVAHAGH